MAATSTPEESVRAGQLAQALLALQNRVRADPGNAKDRIFLFQLLALTGQWERAANQLNVAADLDASTLMLKQIYGHALQAESLRKKVFDGAATPLVLGEPAAWLGLMFESLRLAGEQHFSKAAELRDQALQEVPAISGSINGEKFEWIADGDTRIGPCLEIILDGKYLWVPFDRVVTIKMEAPTDLRDLVWTQAIVRWTNGGQTPALIPTRYAGTELSDDDALRMARRTDWRAEAGETYLGIGQRMLATQAGEYPLLETREIVFDITAVVA